MVVMRFGCFLGLTYGDCWRSPSKVFLSAGNIHVWILCCGHWLSLRSFPSASASHRTPPPSFCWACLTPDQRHFWVLLFSPSIMSNSLQPHGLQHVRFPYPSLSPRVCLNSCPLSWWCHPTISSSVVPFFSHLWSFPASGSFPMSQVFTSGGQSIGISSSASILPMNIQDWFPLGWTGWISLQSKGLSRVFSNTTVQKHQFFGAQLSL